MSVTFPMKKANGITENSSTKVIWTSCGILLPIRSNASTPMARGNYCVPAVRVANLDLPAVGGAQRDRQIGHPGPIGRHPG